MVRQMLTVTGHGFLHAVISREGFVEPDRLSAMLLVTKGELAIASGLSRDAVSKNCGCGLQRPRRGYGRWLRSSTASCRGAGRCRRPLPGTGLSRSQHSVIKPPRTWFVPVGRTM